MGQPKHFPRAQHQGKPCLRWGCLHATGSVHATTGLNAAHQQPGSKLHVKTPVASTCGRVLAHRAAAAHTTRAATEVSSMAAAASRPQLPAVCSQEKGVRAALGRAAMVGRAEGCGAAAARTPPRRAVEEACGKGHGHGRQLWASALEVTAAAGCHGWKQLSCGAAHRPCNASARTWVGVRAGGGAAGGWEAGKGAWGSAAASAWGLAAASAGGSAAESAAAWATATAAAALRQRQ